VRLLVLGVDQDGASRLVSADEVTAAPIPSVPGVAAATLFSTDQSPPPPCPPGLGTLVGGGPAPGCVHWYIVDHTPGTSDDEHAGTELHRRHAIDLMVVLDGDAVLLLADGDHPLQTGDAVVMTGIDHGLRSGPDGCRLMSFAVGTPPGDQPVG
jgi:hypothetical protein